MQSTSSIIRPDTTIVSVMLTNNEIGTIQPVEEIGRGIEKLRRDGKAPHVVFHTDACQAAAYLPLNIAKLHVDLLTLNGSKIYGPKGVGLLYAKRGDQITAIDVWWELEKALRPGPRTWPGSSASRQRSRLSNAVANKTSSISVRCRRC